MVGAIAITTKMQNLTDSLAGILKGDYDLEQERGRKLEEKYEIV